MINTIEKINNMKLVQKAAKGNREAFGELIVMHQEYLYRLAYLHTKNEQDALDAVQECAKKNAKATVHLKITAGQRRNFRFL